MNEGPQVLTHNGRTFLVYCESNSTLFGAEHRLILVRSAAAGSWTRDYNLALMGIDNGSDPMVAKNWWRKDSTWLPFSLNGAITQLNLLSANPVFQQSNVAFGTGHASFTYDRAGVPWIGSFLG